MSIENPMMSGVPEGAPALPQLPEFVRASVQEIYEDYQNVRTFEALLQLQRETLLKIGDPAFTFLSEQGEALDPEVVQFAKIGQLIRLTPSGSTTESVLRHNLTQETRDFAAHSDSNIATDAVGDIQDSVARIGSFELPGLNVAPGKMKAEVLSQNFSQILGALDKNYMTQDILNIATGAVYARLCQYFALINQNASGTSSAGIKKLVETIDPTGKKLGLLTELQSITEPESQAALVIDAMRRASDSNDDIVLVDQIKVFEKTVTGAKRIGVAKATRKLKSVSEDIGQVVKSGFMRNTFILNDVAYNSVLASVTDRDLIRHRMQVGTLLHLIEAYDTITKSVFESEDPQIGEGEMLALLELETWAANIVRNLDSSSKEMVPDSIKKIFRTRTVSTTDLHKVTGRPLFEALQRHERVNRRGERPAGVEDVTNFEMKLKELSEPFQVSSKELRATDIGLEYVNTLMGQGLDKETAKYRTGFMIALSKMITSSHDPEKCFNQLLKAVSQEAAIEQEFKKASGNESLYELALWLNQLSDNDANIGLPNYADLVVQEYKHYKQSILDSQLENSDTEETQDKTFEEEPPETEDKVPSSDVMDLVNQFKRLNFEVFPPGANFEDIKDQLERELSPEALRDVDWSRIEGLLLLRDTIASQGDNIDTKLFRTLPGSLRERFPHYILQVDVLDAKGEVARVVVAETPREGNATYIFREEPGIGWQEVLQLPKRDVRDLGAVAVRHNPKKRSGSHRKRVEDALISELTAIS